MTAPLLLIALGSFTLATSFISGVLGMAGGMLLMAGLLALLPVAPAMVLHGITQLASNAWRAWLWRGSIQWRCVRGFAIGLLLATLALGSAQVVLSRSVVLLLLGATPFLVLAMPQRLELNVDRRGHAFAAGMTCTAIQLLSGVSGPLLDSFFMRSTLDRRAVVATKAAVQALGHTAKTLYFAALAGAAAFDPATAGLMVACALVGTSASRTVLDRMTDQGFRAVTRVSILAIGSACMAGGVCSLLASR